MPIEFVQGPLADFPKAFVKSAFRIADLNLSLQSREHPPRGYAIKINATIDLKEPCLPGPLMLPSAWSFDGQMHSADCKIPELCLKFKRSSYFRSVELIATLIDPDGAPSGQPFTFARIESVMSQNSRTHKAEDKLKWDSPCSSLKFLGKIYCTRLADDFDIKTVEDLAHCDIPDQELLRRLRRPRGRLVLDHIVKARALAHHVLERTKRTDSTGTPLIVQTIEGTPQTGQCESSETTLNNLDLNRPSTSYELEEFVGDLVDLGDIHFD
eukprot:c27452_g1_i1.p1 GENE.c27452_g1_i1~~c27452_g1_i1.p1  ORF type:complete len:269 (+),score=37.38 c27452_g1_i1:58-864(+)